MFTGTIVSIFAVLFVAFFLIYKERIIDKIVSLHVAVPAKHFTEQLEQTADTVIKRLEDQAAHLEILLEEAEAKVTVIKRLEDQAAHLEILLEEAEAKVMLLSEQINNANDIIDKLTELGNKRNVAERNWEIEPEPDSNPNPLIFSANNGANPSNIIENKPQVSNNEPTSADKHLLIFAMSDQGYNVTEIAKATGIGKGEIMLLLQLNKR